MKTEEFTTIILNAEEGHFLTESASDTPIERRTLAKSVALGRYDSPENWEEITEAQAEVIRSQQADAQRRAEAEAARAQSGDSAPDEQEQSSEAASE